LTEFKKVDTIVHEDHLISVKNSHSNHSLIIMGFIFNQTNNISDYIKLASSIINTKNGKTQRPLKTSPTILIWQQPNSNRHRERTGTTLTCHHLFLPKKSYISHILIPLSPGHTVRFIEYHEMFQCHQN